MLVTGQPGRRGSRDAQFTGTVKHRGINSVPRLVSCVFPRLLYATGIHMDHKSITDSRKLLAFQTQENTDSLLVRQLIFCFYLFLNFFQF